MSDNANTCPKQAARPRTITYFDLKTDEHIETKFDPDNPLPNIVRAHFPLTGSEFYRHLRREKVRKPLKGSKQVTIYDIESEGGSNVRFYAEWDQTLLFQIPLKLGVGASVFDQCMKYASWEALRELRGRSHGTRVIWHGSRQLTLYEGSSLPKGHLAIEVRGPHRGWSTEPAWGPAVWPQVALRSQVRKVAYAAVITPGRENSLPAYVDEKRSLARQSLTVYCLPEAAPHWAQFIQQSCTAGTHIEVFSEPSRGEDPALAAAQRDWEHVAWLEQRERRAAGGRANG